MAKTAQFLVKPISITESISVAGYACDESYSRKDRRSCFPMIEITCTVGLKSYNASTYRACKSPETNTPTTKMVRVGNVEQEVKWAHSGLPPK